MAATIGACPGRMPTSPSMARAITMLASPTHTSRSGVTTWTSRLPAISALAGEPLGVGLDVLDPAGHEERLLGQVVVLALGERLEGGDGLVERDVLALDAGELLGHEERLRQEALDAPGPGHGDLVLLRQLVDAQDRDDVLEVLVALQDLLGALSDVVVLLADVARVQDAGDRVQRIDRRVDPEVGDRPR